jgi:signal transduction histidine kinase/ActR/RegA family two-component response regulator
VNAVLVNMVYERLSTSVLLSLVCCILFGSLLAPFFPPGRMIGWVLVMAVVSGGRYLLWRGFMARRPTGAALASWDRWFTLWSMAAGASWAYGPVMLMPAAGRSESLLLMGALLCVCSVAAITQAARMVSMLAFLLAALPPAAWSLAQTGGSVEKIAALEVLVGMLALMLVGRRSHRTICAAVQTELELSQTVRQLDLAREHAESASVAKTRFLANMSHELRSPLNAVIGAAQLMKFGTEDPTAQARLVNAIHQSGTNLLGLIENIMDLSRIEAGQLTLTAAPFDLGECVHAAMATASLAGQGKGLRVQCSIAPDLPMTRLGDALRVRQLLLNLLGNAVKFTSQGQVVVRVQAAKQAGWVHISVSDTGMGISPEALPTVFDAFRQADEGADRRHGGSGLGLAIVRQLLDAMGGSIQVKSAPGQGSCFDMELPLPAVAPLPVPAPVAARAASRPGDISTRQAHVLVVEDDPLNQTIVCSLLRHGGHRTTPASDGASALRLIAETDFDMVLMDWQMPDMDGLEVTRRMRAGAAGAWAQQVPVVALTANAFSEDHAACLAAGMNDFLSKPVQNQLLLDAVARWTQQPEAAQPAT